MTETNFKHTDLGLIPHDWEVKTLEESTQRVSVGLATSVTKYYSRTGVPMFRNLNIKENRLDDSDILYLDETFANANPTKKIHKDDVLTVHTGYVGISCVVPEKYEGALTFTTLITTTKRDLLSPNYLSLYLNSNMGMNEVSLLQAGGGRNNLNVNDFINLRITLPPTLAEQERIAGALSSIDTLIGALTEQIEKKRHIKQGAMQQLLTGKKRLAGFTGAWKNVTFEDVVERFATGLNPRQNFKLNSGGALFYVTIKDFKDGVLYFDNCDKIDEAAFELINKRADLREGDLLFSSIGRVGDAFVIKSTPTNWNINESVYNLRPNYSVIISDFLYHIIKGKELSNKIQDAVTGSTLRSIKMNHLKQISFSIPPTIAEQSAIAAVLSRMDTEIAALEQKRDKYIAIKSGMMQNLLTGKIRLV